MATQVPVTQLPEASKPAHQQTPAKSAAVKSKKKLARRIEKDYSAIYRRSFQAVFLLLNVWIGTQFYFWVRQYEGGAGSVPVSRPAGVEGWLPIAGLMNLKYWVFSGEIPRVHPAAMFLLLTFLSMAFLFRKAFCSWLFRYDFRISLAGREAALRPELFSAALAGSAAARAEVPAAGILRLGHLHHVGNGHP